ncbi:AraC family transcriptional regulator [Nocardioides sp. AN3]
MGSEAVAVERHEPADHGAAPGDVLPRLTSLTDIDDAVRLGSTFFRDSIHIAQRDKRPFRCDIEAAAVGPVLAGQVTYHGTVRIAVDSVDDTYAVHLFEGGLLDVATATRVLTVSPKTASIVRPHDPRVLTGWWTGNEKVTIFKFERRAMEAELRRLSGSDRIGQIDFQPSLDLHAGRGAEWARFARAALTSGQALSGLVTNPLIAAQVSSTLMTGLLLAADHPHRGELEAPAAPATAPHVQRAVRYIEENAQEPLTIPGIASAVGMTTRTLQRGFAEHLGSTPHEYLTRVRMDQAHRDLVAGSPESTSVAQIAARWGFLHQSRFAAKYRSWYGVAPSTTLRGSGRSLSQVADVVTVP